MGTKECRVCYATEGDDGGLVCWEHYREALDAATKASEQKTKWWMQACRQLADVAEAKARADDLSRTVAAMAAAVDGLIDMEQLTAILSRPDVTAERGRWVPMADFERSGAKALVAMAERDHYREKAAVDSTREMGLQLVETAAWGKAEKDRADAAIARAEKAEAISIEAGRLAGLDEALTLSAWRERCEKAEAELAIWQARYDDIDKRWGDTIREKHAALAARDALVTELGDAILKRFLEKK